MTRLACYLITALFYFINGVDCLVRCNNVTTIKSFTRFPPVSVICDHIEMQLFSESFVYFIETDFFTETCTYSLLTKAYISENFIIAAENKTVYRRGPDAHTIRLSCIPEKAEYLTGGIYFLIQRLPNKVTQFKLEKEYRKSVCEHFLNEAAQYSSDESSNEDTVKFIRRATNSEGLTGIFIDGRINYIQCDIVDLPIKNMSIIESECFNGTKVRTNDGQTWYTYNGLDIIDEDKVKEKNITKKEENILEGSTNYIMSAPLAWERAGVRFPISPYLFEIYE
ncbi:Hypothetical protein SRAE_2000126700 [Strongyloides ratti]|uniref:Uncharacterized protein n=1 Tax=Strongyloides ratti TaxID=34506 RepID=A0A090MY56_STRRB|nr:Hypothetical protein SRAE_2000126700 [Strongyloides ratti]CEF66599.1 Hypothetical protein SRAE_2000126700 [Strongyloides ratti]